MKPLIVVSSESMYHCALAKAVIDSNARVLVVVSDRRPALPDLDAIMSNLKLEAFKREESYTLNKPKDFHKKSAYDKRNTNQPFYRQLSKNKRK
jgi:hypothetical protein